MKRKVNIDLLFVCPYTFLGSTTNLNVNYHQRLWTNDVKFLNQQLVNGEQNSDFGNSFFFSGLLTTYPLSINTQKNYNAPYFYSYPVIHTVVEKQSNPLSAIPLL